jgi:hypothetical protein
MLILLRQNKSIGVKHMTFILQRWRILLLVLLLIALIALSIWLFVEAGGLKDTPIKGVFV